VASFDAGGLESHASAVNVTTPAAADAAEPPYCHSRTIDSITWHWPDAQNEPNGSDLWPVTWGRDGNVYAFFGDGGGFGGDDHRGRTSFGIAMITGSPPPTPDQKVNVYGGERALHAAEISGKASSIIAVGDDFYAIAEIYRPTDTPGDYASRPSGSPNHIGLAYSRRNAYSWRDGGWNFCSANPNGGALSGRFCPTSFVAYGRANAGAPGGFVYVLGVLNSAPEWSAGIAATPSDTYLARVSQRRILEHAAYWYFAGLDARGVPIWTHDSARMQPVFRDRNGPRAGCGGSCNMASTLADAIYDATLQRYIGIAQGDHMGQSSFYDAPDLWGPWTCISYNNIDAASGGGGWDNLGTGAGDSMGIHPISAWTSQDGKTLWLTFSSNGRAPPQAQFPPPGTAMDSFNLVSATLNAPNDTGAPRSDSAPDDHRDDRR
jgi:hypothetical protein